MGTTGPRCINPSAQALKLAEQITDKASQLPWPVTAFLAINRNGNHKLDCLRSNDPPCDRLRTIRGTQEVGTYTARASVVSVRDDVLEALQRLV